MATLNYPSRVPLAETAMILAIVAVGLYAFMGLRSEYRDPQRLRSGKKSVATAVAAPQWQETLKSPLTLEVYIQRFSERDIFSEAVAKPESHSETAPVTNTGSGILAGRYKVIGIVLSENPEAVIEDASTYQTIFLKEGQEQAGLIVKKIQKGSVLVEYMGQTEELKTQPQ